MRLLRRTLGSETGQSTIILALSLVALCAVAALVIDIGLLGVNKSNLQTAADAAALAAAHDLPSASTAESTAIHYAQLNGVEAGNVTVTTPYNGDPTKVEVVCSEMVQYSFAQVLGFTSKEVTARAVAQKTGMSGGAFEFALFSGSQSDTLSLSGSSQYIGGSAHSNYKFTMNGSSQTVTGNVEAVSHVTFNGSKLEVGGTCQGSPITIHGSKISVGHTLPTPAAVIEMPDFTEEIKAQAEAAGTKYSSSQTFNGGFLNLDSPIYVEGDVVINGSHFSGTGFILATGDITFNGSSLKNASSDSFCFYSRDGNIRVNGSNCELDGILYAPNGSITMNGSNQTIHGRVIGDEVIFHGSNTQIIAGSNDLNCLPGSSVRLVE